MGVKIYWYIVAIVIILGMILPQEGKDRKYYIFLMTVLHTFVCGWRYIYLTGDLRKYAYYYGIYNDKSLGWFDEEIFHGGRNAGFQWICKAFSMMTDGDFHIFLICLAIFMQVSFAILIYYYSPRPWLSYLIWNCMSFYLVYGFTTIKQGLAMTVLLYAMMAIFQQKKRSFFILVLLAGFIHAPAFVFLPAYLIANKKITENTVIVYIITMIMVYLFKKPIAEWGTDIYYEDAIVNTNKMISLGGRFVVICIIILCGLLIKGFRERQFETLFTLMVIAASLQIFSGYNNVFTRFSDYYFQFTVLFIPMIFYKPIHTVPMNDEKNLPPFIFDQDSLNFFVMLLTVILIWFYHVTCLGRTIELKADDYLNYRFNWEVQDEKQAEQYEEVKY
ncbi:MAG: EpsG family protein [Eubacterium sp.]|nr:EpsG family protein [Eubacterium sp.]